jgi:hypothetical protein
MLARTKPRNAANSREPEKIAGSLTITSWRLGIAASNPRQSAIHTITVPSI